MQQVFLIRYWNPTYSEIIFFHEIIKGQKVIVNWFLSATIWIRQLSLEKLKKQFSLKSYY